MESSHLILFRQVVWIVDRDLVDLLIGIHGIDGARSIILFAQLFTIFFVEVLNLSDIFRRLHAVFLLEWMHVDLALRRVLLEHQVLGLHVHIHKLVLRRHVVDIICKIRLVCWQLALRKRIWQGLKTLLSEQGRW